MRIFDTAFELVEVLRKGGKYPKRDFVLKAKGFNMSGEIKSDIFALESYRASSANFKSMRLNSREDMVQFCKIARNSTSVLKANLDEGLSDQQCIQCIQLVFEVREEE